VSFKWKTSLTITCIILVILIITHSFVFVTFSKMAIAYQEDLLVVRIDQLIDDIRKNPKMTIQTWQSELERNQYIRIIDRNGRIIFEKGVRFPKEWVRPELAQTADEPLSYGKFDYKVPGAHIIFARKTIPGQVFGEQMLTFELYENADSVDKLISFIRNLLLIGSLGGIIIAAFASYLTAKITIRPIGAITWKVKRLDVENLHERIALPPSKDELREMAVTLNGLLERLEAGFDKQKQFIADASHELRTPLAIIEGHANLLRRWGKHKPDVLDESLDYMLKETERLRLLTDQLLQSITLESALAGSENGEIEPAPLGETLEAICSQAVFLNESVKLDLQLPPSELFTAIPQPELRHVLLNIISNAMKYTQDGGKVSVRTAQQGTYAEIVVEDNGIGIAEADMPYLFERFYRADKSRNRERGGSGLGLPIAKKIIDLFKGHMRIESKLGHGTLVTILLPLARRS
jgi:two-component system sensor histidine kinase ArlS